MNLTQYSVSDGMDDTIVAGDLPLGFGFGSADLVVAKSKVATVDIG